MNLAAFTTDSRSAGLGSAVYVVDDDASIRDSVRSLLRSVGLDAEVFASAEEFLQAERPETPSCLILDVRLPGVNGLDFQERLKNLRIEIPVVFITAHSDIPSSVRALKGGAAEFLSKPFQAEELLTAVNEALKWDRTRREEHAGISALQTRLDNLVSREREVTFDIALLNKMAGRLSAADPLHQVLDDVVEFVTAVVECDSCMIYVLEGEELFLRASKNPHPEATDRLKMRVGEGITGWVAEHREPVVVSRSAHEDPRFKLFNELPEDRFEGFLSVPLVSGGRLVGVINLQNRAPREYSKREVRLVATIGFLVGAEVERARLEDEKSELSERLQVRMLLERAKGILQRDLAISEEQAFRAMQKESQQRRKPMREIAEAVILSDDLRRRSPQK